MARVLRRPDHSGRGMTSCKATRDGSIQSVAPYPTQPSWCSSSCCKKRGPGTGIVCAPRSRAIDRPTGRRRRSPNEGLGSCTEGGRRVPEGQVPPGPRNPGRMTPRNQRLSVELLVTRVCKIVPSVTVHLFNQILYGLCLIQYGRRLALISITLVEILT